MTARKAQDLIVIIALNISELRALGMMTSVQTRAVGPAEADYGDPVAVAKG